MQEFEARCKAEVERIDRSHWGFVVAKGKDGGYKRIGQFDDYTEALRYSRLHKAYIRHCLIDSTWQTKGNRQ